MKDKVGTVISISVLTLSSDTPRKLGATCFLLGKSAIRHAWVRPHRTTKRFSLRDMVNAMPRFCCLTFAEDGKISCSWRIRVYSVLNMLENKIGRKKEETEEETEPCIWPGCIATTIPFVV